MFASMGETHREVRIPYPISPEGAEICQRWVNPIERKIPHYLLAPKGRQYHTDGQRPSERIVFRSYTLQL